MGITKYIILGVAAFALAPMPPEADQSGQQVQPVANLQTHEVISGAIGAFTDVASFCVRQPQTCEAMGDIATIAEAKAKYSFRLAYEWANGAATGAAEDTQQLKGTVPVSAPGDDIQLAPPRGADQPTDAGLSDLLKSSSATDPITTNSTTQLAAGPDTGTNTLKIDDLVPEWRGPDVQKQS